MTSEQRFGFAVWKAAKNEGCAAVDLILDDGSVTHLKPFDTVIQRGTNHEWVCTVRRQRPTLSTHWLTACRMLSAG